MYILVGLVCTWIGIMIGFLLHAWLSNRFRDYSGIIHVEKDQLTEKTVYSLELADYPEKLEFQKVVVFKVDTSDRSSNRE
jgi:hypothetical protein